MPSPSPSAKRVETRFDHASIDSVSDDASSELSQLEVSGTSPNYMKANSCSGAKKESFHDSEELDSWKPNPVFFCECKTFGEFKKSADFKIHSPSSSSSSEDVGKKGGIGIRKTLKKKPRSTGFGSFRTSRTNSRSPNYLKATSCSEGKKMNFQASLHDSESCCASNINESRRNSKTSKPNAGCSSLKSVQTLRRSTSLRPLRILISKPSFKSKKFSVKKCPQVSEDLSVNRATCSSTLKDTKFPHHVEVYPAERESERISVMKVCPYNYCSLHGHHHSSAPPLKRLKSRKRRLLKTQKSIKLRTQSSIRATKYADDIMKLVESSQTVMNGEPQLQEDEAKPGMEYFRRSSEENEDVDLAEVLFGETSYPDEGVWENLNQERNFVAEKDIPGTCFTQKEQNFEACCIETSSPLLSLKPENRVATCDESSCSNSDFHESENDGLAGISGEQSNIVKRSTPDDEREATEDKSAISSAFVCHNLEEIEKATDEKNGDLATDHRTVGHIQADSTEVYEPKLHKKKHISMWHLIHQHMVSEGADEEKHVEDTIRLPPSQSSGSSSGFSDSHQNTSIENHDTDNNQEIELHKMYAIKTVREAIEKILLPEVQGQSPVDKPISSNITSDQELLEKNQNSTSVKIADPEQEVSAPNEGGAEKKTLKNWSNLKKLLLLKRFIKALEKVRHFNPRKLRKLPLDPDPEAEKVCLKHQMLDRKKSSEEWMLDFALQQAVSELAPTQKKKVSLLIKAFETVVPLSDEQQIQVAFPKLKGIIKGASCAESELDKCVPEVTYRDTKVEDTVRPNPTNAFKNSIIHDKQSNIPEDGKAEQELVDMMSNCDLELLKDDSAASGQAMKDDGSNGNVTDNNTFSANNGPFVQLNVVGEPKNGGSGSQEQLITNQKSSLTGDHSHFTISSSLTHTLKPYDKICTFSDEVPNMNSEFCKEDDPKSNSEKLEMGDLIAAIDGPLTITKRTTSVDMAEYVSDNTGNSSVCDCGPTETLTAAKEQKNGDSKLDTESIEALGSVRDAEPDNSGHKAYKAEFDKEKHVSMWHLIHQQMVAGLTVEGQTKQLDKENEEHLCDAHTLTAAESQEVEVRKIYAIKLVREAIEKILLPEVQDQSSDDQSVTGETISEQELIEKNSGEEREPSISISTDSAKDRSMDRDISLSQEGTELGTTNIAESENEKTASEVQNKTDEQTLKGWSNLKKMILLKRFIKELEKVRKFNPQKPRFLPLKPDPEAEKVRLRNQMMDERKSAEEWMLDYALRKVVSELAPKQKRKVALLVKAFETVAPPSEEPQIQVAFPKVQGINRECFCSQSEQNKFVSKAIEADIKVNSSSNLDKGGNTSTSTDEKSDVSDLCMSIIKYPQFSNNLYLMSNRIMISSSVKVVKNEDQRGVLDDMELLKDGHEWTGKNVKIGGVSSEDVVLKSAAPDGNREPTAIYNIASLGSDYDQLEQLAAKGKNGNSEIDCTAKVAHKTQLDKQKYISMWHLLCQHVVSDIATKVETQFVDGEDEDEQVDGARTILQTSTDSCSEHRADHHTGKEDLDSSNKRTGFTQRDAVKLVKEAIEEILVPEIQDDSSDAQSVASDIAPEQELPEKNHGGVDTPKDSVRECEKGEVEGHKIFNQEDKGFAGHNIQYPDQQRAISFVGTKSDQNELKNWSKLKKLILLKRTIKALEKARKSNIRAPQILPRKPEPDPEEEKADLRHQLMDEKKKAEEWMLDYALQHIVTKLTPARKRRVSMLVEAFEAVVPLPGV
ncbi:calmodulin binding protein [Actinidia rufa]|uniref:Calmodulin binding protein n=1 Tax=Actinidia rufa TaxID=165716 RepID=A0A7J0FIA5_9ERIC|nr:calmodulin binding protein [Actinidia rufa]